MRLVYNKKLFQFLASEGTIITVTVFQRKQNKYEILEERLLFLQLYSVQIFINVECFDDFTA